MSQDWKNDRMESEIRAGEKENIAKAIQRKKEKRESEWLIIYEKCKDCTDSPSMTRGVIQWFIDNNYEIPKQDL